MEISCCVICFRLEGRNDDKVSSSNWEKEEDTKRELFQRFFKLLERHLNGDECCGAVGAPKNSKENDIKNSERFFEFVKKFEKLPVCEVCLDVLKSFCELYHKIKYLELLLNGKMQTVINIMFCAQRIPARLTCFKNSAKIELEKQISGRGDEDDNNVQNENAGSVDVDDKIQSILAYKKYLIKKCSHKFTNGYPKLSLRRLESGNPVAPTPSPPPNLEADILDLEITNEEGPSTIVQAYQHCRRSPDKNLIKNSKLNRSRATSGMPEPVTAKIEIFEQSLNTNSSSSAASFKYQQQMSTAAATNDENDEDINISNSHHYDIEEQEPIPSPMSVSSSSDHFVGHLEEEADDSIQPSIPPPPLSNIYVNVNADQQQIDIGNFKQGLPPPAPLPLKLEASFDLLSSSPFEFGADDVESAPDEQYSNIAGIDNVLAVPLQLQVPVDTQEEESFTGRRLRTKHCCKICRKTFSSSDKLIEHEKSSVCKTSIQDSDSDNDEEVKFQPKKEKLQRIIKTSEDDDDYYNENSDGPPSNSSSNDSDSVDDNDIDSKEDFKPSLLTKDFSNSVFKSESNHAKVKSTRRIAYQKHKPKPQHQQNTGLDEELINCSICHNYLRPKSLYGHLKKSHPKAYRKKMKMKVRKRKMNKKYAFIDCTACNKRFHTTQGFFNLHLRKLHPEIYQEKLEERLREKKGEVKGLRVLCPELECHKLFNDVRDMALHRKNAHVSSETSPAPEADKPISVEILKFQGDPPPPEEIFDREKSQFEVFAKIEIPANVFSCSEDHCKYVQQIFFFEEDFKEHSRLHGKFPCLFCDFEDNHRTLAFHELSHLPPEKKPKKGLIPSSSSGSDSDSDDGKTEKKSSKKEKVHCPRCNYIANSTNAKQLYGVHHFKAHLRLMELRKRSCCCPICRIPLSSADLRKEFDHLKSFHDLTINPDSEEKLLHRCSEPNCTAYCLSSQQLNKHLKAVHQPKVFPKNGEDIIEDVNDAPHSTSTATKQDKDNISKIAGSGGEGKRYVCPDANCNLLFQEFHEMISHRKNSHPSSPEGNSLENGNIFVEIVKFKKGGSHSNTKIGKSLNRRKQNFELFAKFEIPGNIFSCPEAECGQQCFFFEEDLESHLQLHGRFNCEFCDFIGTYAVALAEHEIDKHGTVTKKGDEHVFNWLKCPRCEDYETTHKQKYFQHHLTSHLLLQLVEQGCPICRNIMFPKDPRKNEGRRREEILHFERNHNLLEVVTTTEENGEKKINYDKLHKCSGPNNGNCSAYFLTQKQFRTHFKNAHTSIKDTAKIRRMFSGKLQCPTCGKISKNARTLIGHRRLMHPELMIPCTFPQCTKIFDTKDDLEFHMKVTHGRRGNEMIVCQKCGKGVCGEFQMRRHMAVHERKEKIEAGEIQVPERGWVCELCGKAFKFKEKLQKHMQTHTGPESYKFECEVCNRKCSTKHTLKEHMRTHSHPGEKRFVCQVCGEAYAHRHNLRNHVNNKHGDVMQDIPKKFDFSNHKRKSKLEVEVDAPQPDKSKRRRRKPPTRQESESEAETPLSSDSE